MPIPLGTQPYNIYALSIIYRAPYITPYNAPYIRNCCNVVSISFIHGTRDHMR